MIQIDTPAKCCGCHACRMVCPKDCVEMRSDREGFLYPKVDSAYCIECGLCETVCPIINSKEPIGFEVLSFACQNKDQEMRRISSSGGVFTLLAEQTISSGGVVFGAGFDKQMRLSHSFIEKSEGLDLLRGSKYLQSVIGDSYRRTRDFLAEGRPVLFSGTPCQIDGLKRYLGKDDSKLLCVDFICHGVPSPGVFEAYRKELEERVGSRMTGALFRVKDPGWKEYSSVYRFENGKELKQRASEDPFLKGFLANLYLRPSCHDCKNRFPNKSSDITLGDYWGIDSVYPEMNDNTGTSLILINSEKGLTHFKAVSDKMKVLQTDPAHAFAHNPCAVVSVKPHKKGRSSLESLKRSHFRCL